MGCGGGGREHEAGLRGGGRCCGLDGRSEEVAFRTGLHGAFRVSSSPVIFFFSSLVGVVFAGC